MSTVLQANEAGLDLVVFASGQVYPIEGDILVARTGSEIQTAADLKGKTVGVPGLGAFLHFMLVRNLKQNGVDPSSMKYVEVGFPQAAEALKAGQIDAYPAVPPFTARILQSGVGYEVNKWNQVRRMVPLPSSMPLRVNGPSRTRTPLRPYGTP
jgi:NitT/TauT family transport system substrate-binding protein